MTSLQPMITFKQFIQEDTLEDLNIALWFRKTLGLSKEYANEAARWVRGEIEYDDLDPELWQTIYEHFERDMPYNVAKMRGDVTPDEWILHHEIFNALKKLGIDT